jgi:hypothetical protein
MQRCSKALTFWKDVMGGLLAQGKQQHSKALTGWREKMEIR